MCRTFVNAIYSRFSPLVRSFQPNNSHQVLLNCGMDIEVLKGFNSDFPLAMYSTQNMILEAENGQECAQSMKSFLERCVEMNQN